MNKLKLFTVLGLSLLLLAACEKEPTQVDEPLSYTVNQSDNPVCENNEAEYTTDEIAISEVSSETNDIFGDLDKFINPCKTEDVNPLVFANAKLKSYFIEISLDAIYPINSVAITNFLTDDEMGIKEIDLSVSLDGESFTKIEDDYVLSNTGEKLTTIQLNNQKAKYLKISFRSEVGVGNYGSEFFGLNDISIFLGEGFIVKEATEWDEALTRYDGWTGADGIFTFNLDTGNDSIGTETDSTLFIFSDTILGNVNPETFLRTNPEFLNNTIGYFNGNDTDIYNNMEFEWNEEDGLPANIFEPDSYIGYQPSNLINRIGLVADENGDFKYDYTISGSSWLSSSTDSNPVITVDLLDIEDLTEMTLYNFIENPDYSATKIKVSHSNDKTSWSDIGTYDLSIPEKTAAISPSNIDTNSSLDLTGISAQYIKIEFLDNNTDTSTQVGLSKIVIQNGDKKLFGTIEASSYDNTDNEESEHPRLWLQDGVVIGEYFYTFPLLVKDYETFFKVFKIGLIKVPIVDKKLDTDNIEFLDAPLQNEMSDGSITYFGAGVNNQDTSGSLVHQDGYIYIYGYKDHQGGRYLTVARVEEENFENFNKWTYFDGESWSSNIDDCESLINNVSPELSVTYINEGIHAGEYMLVVMKNTTSGTISVSYSDTPYGPWTDYETVYIASKIRELPGGFAYNAKMHPHLSEEGKYLISYNVNTTGLTVMSNAEIYHPRFIWLIETKEK